MAIAQGRLEGSGEESSLTDENPKRELPTGQPEPMLLAGAFGALETPALVLDENNRCLFANAVAASLLGAMPDGLTCRRLDEALPREQAERLIGLVSEAALTGAPSEGSLPLSISGERRVRVSVGRFQGGGAAHSCLAVHIQDVSWRLLLEEELLRAREAAIDADRAKAEFIANMSHELRTPLNGSIGMLDLLRATILTPEQRECVSLSQAANRNLLEIINDILDYARIVSGEFKLNEREFGVEETVRSVVGALIPQATGKGLRLAWEMGARTPVALIGDDSRLRQILFNLLGNAVKFTRSGQVRLAVDCRPDPDEPGAARLTCVVTDSGIGIPRDKLERIFDPFTQVDGSYTRRFQGTGLGLGIVRRLVTLMRGEISVVSEPGLGTEFTFYVRMGLPESSAQAMPVETCALLPRLKILLAEDDGTNQIMISRMLEKMGHGVYCVENGLEALKALKEEAFDCILMDVQMPVMSGLDAARTIRSAPGFEGRSQTPIIAATAHALKGDRERFLRAGMNECLFKPFTMEELSRMLARVLGTGAGRGRDKEESSTAESA